MNDVNLLSFVKTKDLIQKNVMKKNDRIFLEGFESKVMILVGSVRLENGMLGSFSHMIMIMMICC